MFDNPNHHLSTQQIHANITQFIECFYKYLKASDKALIFIDQHQQQQSLFSDPLNNLFKSLSQVKQYTSINKLDMSSAFHYNHTRLRFITRLLEITALIRNRKHTEKNKKLLHTYLERIQDSIKYFKTDKNLNKLFSDFFVLSSKFYQGCSILLKNQSISSAILPFDMLKVQEQMETQLSHQDNIKEQKALLVRKQKQIDFLLTNELSIDFDYVSSMIFLANNQKEELVRLMNERNKLINKFILSYSKDYQQFIKKKERVEKKKNRIKQLKRINHNTFTTNFRLQDRISKTLENYSQSSKNDSIDSINLLKKRIIIYDDNKFRHQSSQSKESYSQQQQKKIHPIKNIVLTFNKQENHKTPKNAFHKMFEDPRKAYMILKESKNGFKSIKSQHSIIQQNFKEIQANNFSNTQPAINKNHQSIIQIHPFNYLPQNRNNQPSQKRQLVEKSRNIRKIRKSQMSQTLKHFNLVFQHEKCRKD